MMSQLVIARNPIFKNFVIPMVITGLLGGVWYKVDKYTVSLKNNIGVLTQELEVTKNEFEVMQNINKELLKELELRQDITSLVVDASRSYNLDPKLLAVVLKTESNFRPNPKHKLPQVVGVAGINTKANPKTLHNPQSYVGNVYASAEILANYVESSDSLTLALTRYKGLSPMGYRQARNVLKEYENIGGIR
jgi:hypothetical protein